jgi:protein SCO1/2
MRNGLLRARDLKFSRYILCAALALTGCNPEKQWQLTEITGHLPNLYFSLRFGTGRPPKNQAYRVMPFFGFASR